MRCDDSHGQRFCQLTSERQPEAILVGLKSRADDGERVAGVGMRIIFENRSVADYRIDIVFEKRGDAYWVNMIPPEWDMSRARAGQANDPVPSDAPRGTFPLVMASGSHNKQAYWVPSVRGEHLVRFPLTWRIDDQRWVPVSHDYLHPPEAPTSERRALPIVWIDSPTQ